jgi:hypothetical protein
MLKFLLSVVAVYLSLHLQAQAPFQHLSFEAALAKAKKENKLVFLQMESAGCAQCNDVANRAFADEELIEEMQNECISIKVAADDVSWEAIRNRYNTRNLSGSLFLDGNGILIHRYNGTTSRAASYIDHIATAKSKLRNAASYYTLEKSYQQGNRDLTLLRQYLNERKQLNLDTDSLLNEYTSLLPPDSLQSVETLKFIAYFAPVLASPADETLRRNGALFQQAWNNIPLPERVSINNNIINKSNRVAIEKRDVQAARRVAVFALSTHTNPVLKHNAYESNLLTYYKAVHDTTAYLQIAVAYYDRVYMSVKVDSIKKIDSLTLVEKRKTSARDTLFTGEGVYTIRTSVISSPSVQRYSSALNNAAWTVYNFTNERSYLNKALGWAKRANEFFETEQSLDTYARILYKLNSRKEAIYWQEKAIERAKKVNASTTELDIVLGKMKNGEKNLE